MEFKTLLRYVSLAILAALLLFSHVKPFLIRGVTSFDFAVLEMFVLQAEVSLLAAWWALARPGVVFRTLLSGLILWFIWITTFRVGLRLPLLSSPQGAAEAATRLIVGQLVPALIWFLILFRIWGFRWKWLDAPPDARRSQFNLRQLFALIAVTAFLLTLSKFRAPPWQSTPPDRSSLQILTVYAILAGVLHPPFVAFVFYPTWRFWWLVPYFVLGVAAEGVIIGHIYNQFGQGVSAWDAVLVFGDNLLWNAIQLVPTLSAAVLLRFGGIRVERGPVAGGELAAA